MWNNRHELTLTGRPIHGPLFQSREYMEWYVHDKFNIFFFSVPHLLNDPGTKQNPPQ